MAADPTRRPRSPVSDDDQTRASPSVSELSSVVADSSGSIRSAAGDAVACDPWNKPVFARPIDEQAVQGAADMSDVESLASSSVASEDDSDVESERSTSETYYDDLGGEAVLDNSDWEFVVSRSEITRTYASDSDDGGACPDVDDEMEEEETVPLELPKPPSDISDDDDVEAVVLTDDEHVLVDDTSSEEEDEEETEIRQRMTLDKLNSASSSSMEDDDVVKVSLSDGEEVLADEEEEDEETKREKMMIALRAKRSPSWSSESQEEDKKVVDLGSTTPRRSRVGFVGTGYHCSRREILMERLRTVRTALQMVQVDTAAKSASAQLEAGEASRTEMSEAKSKAKRELAALSTTLDFLAKMALQKAIELEAFQEQRNGKGCTR